MSQEIHIKTGARRAEVLAWLQVLPKEGTHHIESFQVIYTPLEQEPYAGIVLCRHAEDTIDRMLRTTSMLEERAVFQN